MEGMPWWDPPVGTYAMAWLKESRFYYEPRSPYSITPEGHSLPGPPAMPTHACEYSTLCIVGDCRCGSACGPCIPGVVRSPGVPFSSPHLRWQEE